MGKTFRPCNPNQDLLFPKSLKEYVPEGHIAHFVVKVVSEELDLGGILASYRDERGFPPHSSKMMTALLLYGYMQGVYSSRKLAQACEERTDFMVISGMNTPDHRPIANFRRRHKGALEELFKQIVSLCNRAGLVKLQHVAIDGTKIKANASESKNIDYKELKEREKALVERWFEEAEEIDTREDAEYGESRGDEFPNAEEALRRIREAKKALEEEDKQKRDARKKAEEEGKKPKSKVKERTAPLDNKQYNFTDPESGLMRTHRGHFLQGHNSQIAVDAGSQVVVACDVSRAKNDLDELLPMLKKVKHNCGRKPKEVSADSGYCSTENLKALKKNKVRGYIPKTAKIADVGVIKEMSLRLKRGGTRSRFRIRQRTVEPVFGILKFVRAFSHFLTRGLQNVKTEWTLACSAHNLWKLAAVRG